MAEISRVYNEIFGLVQKLDLRVGKDDPEWVKKAKLTLSNHENVNDFAKDNMNLFYLWGLFHEATEFQNRRMDLVNVLESIVCMPDVVKWCRQNGRKGKANAFDVLNFLLKNHKHTWHFEMY